MDLGGAARLRRRPLGQDRRDVRPPSGPDAKVGGQWHSFFVEGIDALHDLHGRNGATICSPLEAKPWGLREYTVRDLNGHYLRFGQRGSDRSATAGREPATDVAIVERLPTPEEYLGLVRAVGWARRPPATDRAAQALAGARFGVVAVDGGRAVGAGMVLGDGATFAYLKDIMVRPEWQARGPRHADRRGPARHPPPFGARRHAGDAVHRPAPGRVLRAVRVLRPRDALRDEPVDRATCGREATAGEAR